MKVKELIEMLEDFDGDMEVATAYDYGDHTHTQAVNFPREVVAKKLTKTAYSDSGYAVPDAEDEQENEDTHNTEDKHVVII